MKIVIDDNLKGKELTKFLVDNKSQLISQKKSMVKRTEPVGCATSFLNVKAGGSSKIAIGDIAPDATSVMVKVVANTALWCDSQMDVLLPDCWKKTIKERKGMIPHLHDHIHELSAEVGDVKDIYSEQMLLTALGVNKMGATQALIFETEIKKSYNEQVFTKYKTGKIKQHSIGLLYVKLELAINDPESEKEFDFWNKYIDQVINADVAIEKGFFWVVPEIKLLENSAVLFGSNELTPTLEVKSDTTNEPGNPTQEEPSTQKDFNLDEAISKLNFIF